MHVHSFVASTEVSEPPSLVVSYTHVYSIERHASPANLGQEVLWNAFPLSYTKSEMLVSGEMNITDS